MHRGVYDVAIFHVDLKATDIKANEHWRVTRHDTDVTIKAACKHKDCLSRDSRLLRRHQLDVKCHFSSSSSCGKLAGLGKRLVDAAYHVKGLLRQLIVLTVTDRLEAIDGLGYRCEFTRYSGELLGNEHRL